MRGKGMQHHEDEPLLIKPTEAARMAGVSTRTITRMCEAGQIKAVKMRGVWRINRAAFFAFIDYSNKDFEM